MDNKKKKKYMCLTDAPSDTKLKILGIKAGLEIRRKLNAMGLHTNDLLVKLNTAKWGPILIQNFSSSATKLALSRKLAEDIIVDYEK